MARLTSVAALLLLAPAVWAFSNKEVPSWVQEASSLRLPPYSGRVPAAVLLSDQHITLDESGMMTTVERRAIRILTEQGKRRAFVRVHYWKKRHDVKDLRAWLIAPDGTQKTFDKSSFVDRGVFNNAELYTDGRILEIAALNSEVGSVFAYEYTIQEKAVTAQTEFYFQTELPSLRSRFAVSLPSGWTPNAVFFNQSPIQPIVEASTYIWEAKDLPFRDAEDESASAHPRLAVSFIPPGGSNSVVPTFNSWADVSRWQSSLAQGQDSVTPEISTKATQLTAGSKSDYEKLCAIGRYVQNIRYVAIEMDLQNGGGYVPHQAADVFANQYGDCKDKANLMRCMLRAVGLDSYLVDVYANDRTHVREQWPSPHQFNHMILAAKVPETAAAPSIVSTPLGRLLIFDPTDDQTPMGDLPWREQGSTALLLAGDRGVLLTMPTSTPETNALEVSVDATLSANGSLAASLVNSKTGQLASAERHLHATEKEDQYKALYQRTLNDRAKIAAISQLVAEDHFEQNKFDLKISFDSLNYAQSMQGRLLVFSPAVVDIPRYSAPAFLQAEKRVNPVVLRASLYRKTVRIKLPDGFTVDEVPSPMKADSDFARFSLAFKQEPGMLVMTEELRTEAVMLPPDQFEKVKKFFDNCRSADRQNAVLVK
jgi:uncharacterized protein DUF3857/transglutaminase superfamily protein